MTRQVTPCQTAVEHGIVSLIGNSESQSGQVTELKHRPVLARIEGRRQVIEYRIRRQRCFQLVNRRYEPNYTRDRRRRTSLPRLAGGQHGDIVEARPGNNSRPRPTRCSAPRSLGCGLLNIITAAERGAIQKFHQTLLTQFLGIPHPAHFPPSRSNLSRNNTRALGSTVFGGERIAHRSRPSEVWSPRASRRFAGWHAAAQVAARRDYAPPRRAAHARDALSGLIGEKTATINCGRPERSACANVRCRRDGSPRRARGISNEWRCVMQTKTSAIANCAKAPPRPHRPPAARRRCKARRTQVSR